MNSKFHPIIYVRGYAMTRDEIDDTTADPFCGFNLGSTIYRATLDKDKPAKKFIFESPIIRLHSEFDYKNVFEDGLDIMDKGWQGTISRRSIIIYHYYEQASSLLGCGVTPTIKEFATGLSDLILRVKDLVMIGASDKEEDKYQYQTRNEFKCYLVAHSMGGLVCRAFLQNSNSGDQRARDSVAKVFTYATPHNGIEMAGINIPSWLNMNDSNIFNREKMAGYLDLNQMYKDTQRVDWVPTDLAEKFFCMVGTNRDDYEVAMGASRTFAGHGSDGLVRIENASVWGVGANNQSPVPAATAYAYRSHSGYFGIVNSEESYQNLIRFLFGDLRIDVWCDIEAVSLPSKLENEEKVDAIYQFEVLAAPKGKRWFLTRRKSEEDSVACCNHSELTSVLDKNAVKSIFLSTVFLGNNWKVNPDLATLAYCLTFGVRAPDYEVNNTFWFNEHYEGSYLFLDSAILEITKPNDGEDWQLIYSWLGTSQLPSQALIKSVDDSNKLMFLIPFNSARKPGIKGNIRFVVAAWNE